MRIRPTWRQISIAAAVLALAAAACFMFYRHNQPTRPPGTSMQPTPRKTPDELRFPPGASQLLHLQISQVIALPQPLLEPLGGRIAYDENHTARVSSPVAGRVVRLGPNPGDAVRPGDALAWLDAPEFVGAVADLAKSRAELRQKQAAFERTRTLLNAEVIARKDFEVAQADLGQAQAEHERASRRLGNLTRGNQITTGERYVLRAPISGIVAERKINAGNEVRPDAPDPLFVLTDPAHVWVIVDVPEKYLGKIAVGQRVAIEVDAYPGGDFSGRVASIGGALDPATRRLPVRCLVDNALGRLKPEMYARVTPVSDEGRKLPRVPNSSLITQGLFSFVFVEKGPGIFERRRVVPALQGRDEAYIRDGLAEGERIVTSGALLLNSEFAGVR